MHRRDSPHTARQQGSATISTFLVTLHASRPLRIFKQQTVTGWATALMTLGGSSCYLQQNKFITTLTAHRITS